MSWVDDLSKVLPVEKAYDDLVHPGAKQVGEAVESSLKAARFLIAPLEYLGAQHDRYLRYLKRISEKVKDKELVEAHPQISGPVFEMLKYTVEDGLITEMFLNLLARAIDKDRVSEAHPAFVHIVNQLSPDEALMLYEFKKRSFEFWEQSDFNSSDGRFYNNRVIRNDFPVDKLTFPDNFTMYINHLNNLQVAGVPEYRNQEPIMANNKQVGVKVYRKTAFLDFGILFASCCVPEDIVENQNR